MKTGIATSGANAASVRRSDVMAGNQSDKRSAYAAQRATSKEMQSMRIISARFQRRGVRIIVSRMVLTTTLSTSLLLLMALCAFGLDGALVGHPLGSGDLDDGQHQNPQVEQEALAQ